jgi:hypothetical protein
MKHLVIALVSILFFITAKSQYTLRLAVSEVATKKLDDIYVAEVLIIGTPKMRSTN